MSKAIKKFKIVKRILNQFIFDENVIYTILKHYWNILPGKRKVLLPCIDQNKLNWSELSRNKNAIDLLKDNQDKIDWSILSKNKNAISLLKNNIDKIN